MVAITLLGCVACNTDNTLVCSFCGTKNGSEAKFCSDCGKEIKGSAEMSQPEMKKTSEEKLRDYLLENGTKTYDDLYYIKSYEYKNSKYDTYFIYYDKENDEIYFASFQKEEIVNHPRTLKTIQYTDIPLDYNSDYSQISYCYENTIYYVVEGEINKKKYSKSNDRIENIDILSNYSAGNSIAESLCKSHVSTLLEKVEEMLEELDINVTLNQLGFSNY